MINFSIISILILLAAVFIVFHRSSLRNIKEHCLVSIYTLLKVPWLWSVSLNVPLFRRSYNNSLKEPIILLPIILSQNISPSQLCCFLSLLSRLFPWKIQPLAMLSGLFICTFITKHYCWKINFHAFLHLSCMFPFIIIV